MNSSTRIGQSEEDYLNPRHLQLFFGCNDRPSVKLCQLSELLGYSETSDKLIDEINGWAQENLLRRGERWDQQNDRFECLRAEILPLLTDLGFVEERSPKLREYTGSIIHGALISRVRLRLYTLISHWRRGVRFARLYFLTGERLLDLERENYEALTTDDNSGLRIRDNWKLSEIPKTECQMVRLVWEQSDVPNDMREQLIIRFINAPLNHSSRPTTADTVLAWLQTHPPFGHYLAVTNNPYINRQDLVCKTIARKEYVFDTIGPKTLEKEKICIVLDELARFIYVLRNNKHKLKDN